MEDVEALGIEVIRERDNKPKRQRVRQILMLTINIYQGIM